VGETSDDAGFEHRCLNRIPRAMRDKPVNAAMNETAASLNDDTKHRRLLILT